MGIPSTQEGFDTWMQEQDRKDLLRFLTCGSVDDGKSTLIGRLLHDSHSVLDDQAEKLCEDSARYGTTGKGEIDFALLTDGLRAEREQGITIDVAYRYFSTPRRKFIIADTPGHEQYTRNMATGASTCELAVLLVDAAHGITTQTRRHSAIASLLGIKHACVAVNKMDAVGWSQEVFEGIRHEFMGFAAKLGFSDLHIIPVSALLGDNVVRRSEHMPWYRGAPLLDHLENVHVASDTNLIDLRLPIQYVIRRDSGFRGYAGTIVSGILRPGDEILALPSGRQTRVRALHAWEGTLDVAFARMPVVVELEDELDLARGDQIVHPGNRPVQSHEFEATLVWMDETPLVRDRDYRIRFLTNTVMGRVTSLRYRLDPNTLHRQDAETLELNDIGRVSLSCNRAVLHDTYERNRGTGSFILIDRLSNATVGAGMILGVRTARPGPAPRKSATSETRIHPEERAMLLGQRPVTLWLTGLPKAGKGSIARALEERLISEGHLCQVLDGRGLRSQLNQDLGFSADDRHENVRRAAGIARLFNDAGLISIASFVSPLHSDRETARGITGSKRFVEIHCAAPLGACEARDEEGLYERARRGEIAFFSGISAPYEEPAAPDLRLPTDTMSVDECVDRILELLRTRGFLLPKKGGQES